MALLFKPKTAKIIKRQYGGSIPFYAPYQVQMAQTPVANPAALLKLYGNQGVSQEGDSKTKSAADRDSKKPKTIDALHGLNNEAAAGMNKIAELDSFIEEGYMMDPNFHESPEGARLIRERNEQATYGELVRINNQKTFEDAKKTAAEKKGLDNLMYQNGQFFVQDNTTNDVDWINADDINEIIEDKKGNKFQKYKPLTYSEGFTRRENLASSNTMFNNDLTYKLGQGRSAEWVLSNIVDKAYDKIGIYSDDRKTLKKDGELLADKKTMTENATGESTSSNEDRLHLAMKEVYGTLSQPDRDALMAQAWSTNSTFLNSDGTKETRRPTSNEEASRVVEGMIFDNMAKRIELKTTSVIRAVEDESKIKGAKEGDGSGGSKEQAIYSVYEFEARQGMTQTLESDTREILLNSPDIETTIDKLGQKTKVEKSILQKFPLKTIGLEKTQERFKKNFVEKDKNQNEVVPEWSTLDKVSDAMFPIKDAILANGAKITDFDDDGSSNSNYLENIRVNTDLEAIAYLPVKDGTLWQPEMKEVKEYQKDMLALATMAAKDPAYYTMQKRTENGREVYKKIPTPLYLATMKKKSDEFTAKVQEEGVTMKAYYVARATTKFQNDVKNLSKEDKYKNIFVTHNSPKPNNVITDANNKVASGVSNAVDPFGLLGKNEHGFNLLIPVPSVHFLGELGGSHLYVDKNLQSAESKDAQENIINTTPMGKTNPVGTPNF